MSNDPLEADSFREAVRIVDRGDNTKVIGDLVNNEWISTDMNALPVEKFR